MRRVRVIRSHDSPCIINGRIYLVVKREKDHIYIDVTDMPGAGGYNINGSDKLVRSVTMSQVEFIVDDACGDCINACRSEEKCPFYKEE